MRRQVIALGTVLATLAAVGATTAFWRLAKTLEYRALVGDSRQKIAVVISLRLVAPWRAQRILARFLADSDPEVRRAAVAGVAALWRRELLATVERMAREDADVLVRAQAIGTCAALGSSAAPGLAREALTDTQPDMRIAALLSVTADDPPAGAIISLLEDTDSRVRDAAIEAAARLRLVGAVPTLAADLADERLFDAGRAHDALKRITGVNCGTAPAAWMAWQAARTETNHGR